MLSFCIFLDILDGTKIVARRDLTRHSVALFWGGGWCCVERSCSLNLFNCSSELKTKTSAATIRACWCLFVSTILSWVWTLNRILEQKMAVSIWTSLTVFSLSVAVFVFAGLSVTDFLLCDSEYLLQLRSWKWAEATRFSILNKSTTAVCVAISLWSFNIFDVAVGEFTCFSFIPPRCGYFVCSGLLLLATTSFAFTCWSPITYTSLILIAIEFVLFSRLSESNRFSPHRVSCISQTLIFASMWSCLRRITTGTSLSRYCCATVSWIT